MKNEVIINSNRPEIIESARALALKEEYMNLGFSSRVSFVETLCYYFPIYKDQKGISKLQRFWNMRLIDKTVNDHVETAINKLKYE